MAPPPRPTSGTMFGTSLIAPSWHAGSSFPLRRESPETFQYLGFTNEEAQRRYEVYRMQLDASASGPITTRVNTHAIDSPASLMSLEPKTPRSSRATSANTTTVTTNLLLDTVLESLLDRLGLTFQEYFDTYRIRPELQDAIMEPQFDDVRGTAGPGYWVRDTMRCRYAILDAHFVEGGFVPSVTTPAPISTPETDSSEDGSSTSDPEVLDPGGIVLWKGVGAWRTADMFDASGAVNFEALAAGEPERTDLSPNMGLYFHQQRTVAVKFAEYVEHRQYGFSARLIRIELNPGLFKHTQYYRVSTIHNPELWKKFVWQNRFWFRHRGPMVIDKLENFQVIVGHVSTGHGGDIMQGPCHWSELDLERNVMHFQEEVGGMIPAKQIMFRPALLPDLQEAARGNVRIEVLQTFKDEMSDPTLPTPPSKDSVVEVTWAGEEDEGKSFWELRREATNRRLMEIYPELRSPSLAFIAKKEAEKKERERKLAAEAEKRIEERRQATPDGSKTLPGAESKSDDSETA